MQGVRAILNADQSTSGVIADRALETLGESDKGVVMYRRVLLEQIEKIERGEEPLGVVRDPKENTPFIHLPVESHVDYDLGNVDAAPGERWADMAKKAAE